MKKRINFKRHQQRNVPACSLSRHRKSGQSVKSPKLRHAMQREASRKESKNKHRLTHSSVLDLFNIDK